MTPVKDFSPQNMWRMRGVQELKSPVILLCIAADDGTDSSLSESSF